MPARTSPRAGTRRTHVAWALAAVALALLLAACSRGPVPIAYDEDGCDYCRMQISDPRFGGELITRTGKVHKFDSIECLASFYAALQDSATVRSLWVSDYRKPGTLIPAREALYVHHEGPGSPMGRGLLALRGDANAAGAVAPVGDTLGWSAVLKLVSREGLAPGISSSGGAARYGARDVHPH
ncbi:MAG TPA: nitrous oxide reductase accessory protein NosL [Gemmatimonadaceae bacterium]|nr:nitrous oxide reductase accessory protein NosL [Gemmatimonadaceae bacterium]